MHAGRGYIGTLTLNPRWNVQLYTLHRGQEIEMMSYIPMAVWIQQNHAGDASHFDTKYFQHLLVAISYFSSLKNMNIRKISALPHEFQVILQSAIIVNEPEALLIGNIFNWNGQPFDYFSFSTLKRRHFRFEMVFGRILELILCLARYNGHRELLFLL